MACNELALSLLPQLHTMQVRAQPWEPGDILGLALDYTEGKMQLSHQGNWYTEVPGLTQALLQRIKSVDTSVVAS